MKKKIALVALMLVLATVLAVLFAFSVSAEEEIVVKYAGYDGKTRTTATPNEDGTYTLRDTKLSNNGQVTLADGTKVDKVFYGWFTKDGTLYAPGATVTFTESTNLYEAYGIEVKTAEDLAAVEKNNYVRLGADIVTSNNLDSSWGTSVYDLNGHTLTITAEKCAIYNYRGACAVLGKGKLIHAPSKLNTNDGQTGGIVYERHGYGDTSNPQLGWIGKDVEFETPYNFIRVHHSPNLSNMPNIEVYGKVTAKNFIRAGVLVNSTVILHESADVTLNGTTFFDCTSQTGTSSYMNLTVSGKLTCTNADAILFSDFLMTNKFNISQITSGSFTISSTDAERFASFMPDTLMFKETINDDGTVTYDVVLSDCVHNWIYDEYSSVEATFDETGVDIYSCSECLKVKRVITVYAPTDVKINVVVRTEEGDVEYTVLAGDVLDMQFSGFGVNAICCIVGLKDTEEFTASQIVAFDIPVGIVEFSGFDNETVEQINILDGVDIVVSVLTPMKALKTINIGAATVEFRSISKSTAIETVSSDVPGADVKFISSCFDGATNLKNLTFSAGSSYRFEANAFRNTKVQKIIFPDGCSLNFAGDAAFYGCPELYFVYFGSGCIADRKLVRKPFDCCYSLETVVLMDIKYIDQYVFCCNGDANSNASHREGKGVNKGALNVYSHSDTLSINQNAFANRKVLGVNLYTLANVTTISNCVYTIYYGLPHAYTLETIEESTCVENGKAGYVTNCPCGNDYRQSAYTTYSTLNPDLEFVIHGPCGAETIELPLLEEHVDSGIVHNIVYVNGFMNLGTKEYKCQYCDATASTEEEASAPALFACLGYSVPENGNGGITVGYTTDKEAIAQYMEATGKTLKYGVFAVSQAKLGTNDIFDENGEAVGGAICAEIQNIEFTVFEIKLMGLTTDTQKNSKLALGAYVKISDGEATEYSYMQDGTPNENEKYCFVSFNDLVTPAE